MPDGSVEGDDAARPLRVDWSEAPCDCRMAGNGATRLLTHNPAAGGTRVTGNAAPAPVTGKRACAADPWERPPTPDAAERPSYSGRADLVPSRHGRRADARGDAAPRSA